MEQLKGDQKSLFSIQIDDVVIQRVFQGLQNEVNQLRKEVKELKEDVYLKPSRKEVSELVQSMESLKKNNASFVEDIEAKVSALDASIASQLKETRDTTKKEIVDAVFSINNVARAQNTLIEEKIFELTKPTLEFTEMKYAVNEVKKSHELIRDEMKNFSTLIAHVMEVRTFDELRDWSLTKAIRQATQEDRDNIDKAGYRIDAMNNRIETAESLMRKICRNPNTPLPQWQQQPKYEFKNKPKIPRLNASTTFYDYIEYLVTLAPALQKILNAFYHQLTTLSNKIWEDRSSDPSGVGVSDTKKLHDLMNVVEELKVKSVSRAELTQIQDSIAEMKGSEIPRLKLNKITNQLEVLSSKVATFDGIDEKIDTLQKNFDFALTTAMKEVSQSAAVTPGVSPRFFPRDLPASTSVTPRANQAHKVIYGELTSQKPFRIGNDSRLDKKPNLVTKPNVRHIDEF